MLGSLRRKRRAYREYKYQQRLLDQRRQLSEYQRSIADSFAEQFNQQLREATNNLTSEFDGFFGEDTARRNEFIDNLRAGIEASETNLNTISDLESQLVQAVRRGETDRSRIASRSEIAQIREKLKEIRSAQISEDIEPTMVMDLMGNLVPVDQLDINQRRERNLVLESPVGETSQKTLDSVTEMYNEFQSEVERLGHFGQAAARTQYGRLMQKYGNRSPEVMARLIDLYGDTDMNLSVVRDADLEEFLNPSSQLQAQTLEQLQTAMQELDRDELIRRRDLALQREGQRITKNQEIADIRQSLESRASRMEETLRSLGLSSEQLQARVGLSEEGALIDPRTGVVIPSRSATAPVPTFQTRPE